MARKRERTFAAFGAILFLVTSSATTIAVVYVLIQQGKQSSGSNNSSKQETNVNKLQGTKLANFTPVSSVPQLQAVDLKEGTGATVQPGQTVTVDYTGAIAATGIIFQSSKDSGQPVTFPLNQVIVGWSQGIPGMKVGGTRRLLI